MNTEKTQWAFTLRIDVRKFTGFGSGQGDNPSRVAEWTFTVGEWEKSTSNFMVTNYFRPRAELSYMSLGYDAEVRKLNQYATDYTLHPNAMPAAFVNGARQDDMGLTYASTMAREAKVDLSTYAADETLGFLSKVLGYYKAKSFDLYATPKHDDIRALWNESDELIRTAYALHMCGVRPVRRKEEDYTWYPMPMACYMSGLNLRCWKVDSGDFMQTAWQAIQAREASKVDA